MAKEKSAKETGLDSAAEELAGELSDDEMAPHRK